jgi:hypothetical protein
MTLEEAAGLGYGLNINENDDETSNTDQKSLQITDTQQTDESAIVLQENGQMRYQGIQLTKLGLRMGEDPLSETNWRELGRILKTYDDAIQWMLGDWANAGFENAQRWGKFDPDAPDESSKYAALLSNTGYSYGTLSNFAAVARKIPFNRRRQTLTYSHHVEVAYLKDENLQDTLLDEAEPTDDHKRLSVRDLRKRVREILNGDNDTTNNTSTDFLDSQIKRIAGVRREAKRLSPHERKQLAELYTQLADELRDM